MNFRTKQRDRFAESSQRGRTLRLWIIELRKLATSVGDVTDRQLVLQLWKGTDPYIITEWARSGFNPEKASFEELRVVAERAEEAAKSLLPGSLTQ